MNDFQHYFLFRTGVRLSGNYWRGEGPQGPGPRRLPVQTEGGGGDPPRPEGEAGEPGRDGAGPARVVDPRQTRLRPGGRSSQVGDFCSSVGVWCAL